MVLHDAAEDTVVCARLLVGVATRLCEGDITVLTETLRQLDEVLTLRDEVSLAPLVEYDEDIVVDPTAVVDWVVVVVEEC